MKLAGKTKLGGTSFDLAADSKRVARYTLGQAANLLKLSVYADGLGAGAGDQVMRGVVYDTAGVLLAQSSEVLVRDGQAGGWLDLPLASLLALPAASYDFGVHGGAVGGSIRVYGDASAGAGHTNTDTYLDGASGAFGASTTLAFDLSVFATYSTVWAAPVLPGEAAARLPWVEAQEALSGDGGPVTLASLGWYGNAFDDDPGSFAIAGVGGPFEALVGERLLIRNERGGVFAYCKIAATLNRGEDLAVPRRVYSALSLPSAVPLPVDVAVVS